MSYTLTRTEQLSGNGSSLTSTRSYTEGSNPRLSESIPDSSTDLVVYLAIDVSELSLIALYADGALTVQPIKSGPANEGSALTLSATKSFLWGSDDGTANPFSNDLIGFKVTNASGAAVVFSVEALVDPTP